MQTANALVRLGGDKDNVVPVYNITAAEIAVLRVIHGNDAVHNIEPLGRITSTHRAERERLIDKYGQRRPDNLNGEKTCAAVNMLFPGAAARVFEDLEELELNGELYKATTRMSASAAPADLAAPAQPEPVKPKRGRPAKTVEAEAPAPVPGEGEDQDDGIGEIPKRDIFA